MVTPHAIPRHVYVNIEHIASQAHMYTSTQGDVRTGIYREHTENRHTPLLPTHILHHHKAMRI